MGKDLDELLDFIEEEAKAEGPEAVAELRGFDEEYALASQLLDLRLKADLSQQRLATLSGIPQSEISRIETGAANPTYATMRALAGPLGAASVGWFGGAATGLPDAGATVTRQAVARSATSPRSSASRSSGPRSSSSKTTSGADRSSSKRSSGGSKKAGRSGSRPPRSARK